MNLANGFSIDTRNLYLGVWYCWGVNDDGSWCGSNGSDCGGLELHHIVGRRKHMHCLSSALNSALLCKRCHDKVKHSLDEHRQLFFKTLKFLKKSDYQLKPVDIEFMNMNAFELIGKDIELWAIN
jgi:hypothetical protein